MGRITQVEMGKQRGKKNLAISKGQLRKISREEKNGPQKNSGDRRGKRSNRTTAGRRGPNCPRDGAFDYQKKHILIAVEKHATGYRPADKKTTKEGCWKRGEGSYASVGCQKIKKSKSLGPCHTKTVQRI